jgi:hypothetical protein
MARLRNICTANVWAVDGERVRYHYHVDHPDANGLTRNVCMSAFLTPGNLADILFSFNRSSKGAMPSLPEKMVKSIKIRTSHLGYVKKLSQVMSTSARNTFFEKDKKKISVENYFKTSTFCLF